MFALRGVLGENRHAGKAEQVIVFKRLDNFGVHIAKLAAVALVKDDNNMFDPFSNFAEQLLTNAEMRLRNIY